MLPSGAEQDAIYEVLGHHVVVIHPLIAYLVVINVGSVGFVLPAVQFAIGVIVFRTGHLAFPRAYDSLFKVVVYADIVFIVIHLINNLFAIYKYFPIRFQHHVLVCNRENISHSNMFGMLIFECSERHTIAIDDDIG